MIKEYDRKSSIDLLKGIAIILVVITHYSWTYDERMKMFFPFWVDMAIPIFMIISGYVYSQSFERKNVQTFEEAYLPANLADKIIRFTIPFAISYIIEIVLQLITGRYKGIVYSLMIFLCGGDGPGSYYYPVMIQFVFIFPIMYFIIKKCKYGFYVCIFLNLVYEFLFQFIYGMDENYYRLLVFRYIFCIAVGIVLACNDNKSWKKMSWLVSQIITLIVGILYIIVYRYEGKQLYVFRYWTGTSFLASLYIVPIAFMGKRFIKRVIHFKPLEIIGRASYDIFLVQMIYYLFADYVYNRVTNRNWQVIVSVLVCIVGGVSFYYLENSITSKIRNYVVKKLQNVRF